MHFRESMVVPCIFLLLLCCLKWKCGKWKLASEKREKRKRATAGRSQLHLSVLFPGKRIPIRDFQNSRFTKDKGKTLYSTFQNKISLRICVANHPFFTISRWFVPSASTLLRLAQHSPHSSNRWTFTTFPVVFSMGEEEEEK